MRKFFIPEILPIIVTICWVLHLISGSDVTLQQAVAIFAGVVVLPIGFGIYYGYNLKRSLNDQRDI